MLLKSIKNCSKELRKFYHKMKSSLIPVITYHSVGIVNKKWIWRHLTCRWELFRRHLKWLKIMKFHTLSLQQLCDYKKYNVKLYKNPVVITFDDGYLDNWIFAYPLLKKFGFKGTVLVNPEFVDPRNIVRKNLDDVWNKRGDLENLEFKGFLSWPEIKIMEAEGVMDIQSHSMSHTWYFCDNKIIDFHYPGNNKYPWLFWNVSPKRKYLYLNENQEHFVPYGTPIYNHGRSLAIKRYFENDNFTKFIVDFVEKQGNDFFNKRDWKAKLFEQINFNKSQNKLKGRYETDEEQKRRFEYELIESRKILADRLGKKINFLCWPGGAKTDLSIKMSHEAGYLAFTYSAHKGEKKNIYSEDFSRIPRISAPNIQFKDKIYYLGGLALIIKIFSFQGHILVEVIRKTIKLFYIFMIILRIRKNGVRVQ